MAKKKPPKMTAEELAQRAATSRMLEERIAYHQARAVELGEISLAEAQRYSSLRAAAATAADKAGGRITPEEEALRAGKPTHARGAHRVPQGEGARGRRVAASARRWHVTLAATRCALRAGTFEEGVVIRLHPLS
jgi:hypothetical protein